jgi:preprotein translocase subunit SecY
MMAGIKLQHLPLMGSWIDTHAPRFLLEGMNVNFYFGGTSLLIVVGVALDLVNQIEAQLIMRHYENYSLRAARRSARRSAPVRPASGSPWGMPAPHAQTPSRGSD